MGLRPVPQDDSSVVRRESSICRSPFKEGEGKGRGMLVPQDITAQDP